jgi:hypothetical protein
MIKYLLGQAQEMTVEPACARTQTPIQGSVVMALYGRKV